MNPTRFRFRDYPIVTQAIVTAIMLVIIGGAVVVAYFAAIGWIAAIRWAIDEPRLAGTILAAYVLLFLAFRRWM